MAQQSPAAAGNNSFTSLVELAYTRGFTLFAAVMMLIFVLWLQWTAIREIQQTNQEIVRTLDKISARLDQRTVYSPAG